VASDPDSETSTKAKCRGLASGVGLFALAEKSQTSSN
jgi:hypothetical protein